jgi:hypothetical protein
MRIATRTTKSQTSREKSLDDKGYVFSGFYTSESLELAKARAKEYRSKGFFATVVTKNYVGRIYDTTGYSVYIRERKIGEKNEPN